MHKPSDLDQHFYRSIIYLESKLLQPFLLPHTSLITSISKTCSKSLLFYEFVHVATKNIFLSVIEMYIHIGMYLCIYCFYIFDSFPFLKALHKPILFYNYIINKFYFIITLSINLRMIVKN